MDVEAAACAVGDGRGEGVVGLAGFCRGRVDVGFGVWAFCDLFTMHGGVQSVGRAGWVPSFRLLCSNGVVQTHIDNGSRPS